MIRFLFCALFFAACQSAGELPHASQATPFDGVTLSGETFDFEPSASSGATLLVFWASWCASCRGEVSALKALHAEPELDVLGICVDRDADAGRSFAREQALPYPSVSDPELAIADRYGVSATPAMILVDRDGTVVLRTNHVDETLRRALP